jgi:enoyl-[acyl-carrier-protein] reductase (NADH)
MTTNWRRRQRLRAQPAACGDAQPGFANREDLTQPFLQTSRPDFAGPDVSAYSLAGPARRGAVMTEGGSLSTLTYLVPPA